MGHRGVVFRRIAVGFGVALALVAGAAALILPLVRDVQKCRSEAAQGLEVLKDYVARAVAASSVDRSFSEVCDSSTGVTYTVDLVPGVQVSDVARALEANGCEPVPAAPGAFECESGEGRQAITVIASRDGESVRVTAAIDL